MFKKLNLLIVLLIFLNAILVFSLVGHNFFNSSGGKIEKLSLPKQEKLYQSQEIVVSVLNGCGIPGVANLISKEIQKQYGAKVIKTENADNFDYQKTQVIYSSASGPDIENFITLISERVDSDQIYPSIYPLKNETIIIIVGKDYQDFLNFY